MSYTLGTAAKAAGIAKSTMWHAIRDHRISDYKGDAGDGAIDPAEFHPVFPWGPAPNGQDHAADVERGAPPEQPAETALLEARIAINKLAELMRRREQAEAAARLLTCQRDVEAAMKRVDELVNELVAM